MNRVPTVSSNNSDAETSTTPPAIVPPRTLADIPGLGPIRIRALEKAGWSDLSALRTADLDALLAVPGLTEIKARYIQHYLEPFAPEILAQSGAMTEKAGFDAAHSSLPVGDEHELAASSAEVVQRATRAMGEVVTLLLTPEAPQFRSRLLRVLGQFSLSAESIATDAAHLSDDQQARAIRRLRRAGKMISDFAESDAADRKAQGRLADLLEELTSKLAECRLSS